jgi:hypothetical protein
VDLVVFSKNHRAQCAPNHLSVCTLAYASKVARIAVERIHTLHQQNSTSQDVLFCLQGGDCLETLFEILNVE